MEPSSQLWMQLFPGLTQFPSHTSLQSPHQSTFIVQPPFHSSPSQSLPASVPPPVPATVVQQPKTRKRWWNWFCIVIDRSDLTRRHPNFHNAIRLRAYEIHKAAPRNAKPAPATICDQLCREFRVRVQAQTTHTNKFNSVWNKVLSKSLRRRLIKILKFPLEFHQHSKPKKRRQMWVENVPLWRLVEKTDCASVECRTRFFTHKHCQVRTLHDECFFVWLSYLLRQWAMRNPPYCPSKDEHSLPHPDLQEYL